MYVISWLIHAEFTLTLPLTIKSFKILEAVVFLVWLPAVVNPAPPRPPRPPPPDGY